MSIYLDASVLVALFIQEPLTKRAEAALRTQGPIPIVSDFAAAEFTSAIGRRVRTRQLLANEARQVFSAFDAWIAREIGRAQTTSADVMRADNFLRRLDLPLRTPDALHIAIAQRIDADLLTFDSQMAAAARALGATTIRI